MDMNAVRIALLEDDPEQAEVVKRWLEQAGHDVHVFGRGMDLLRRASRESFDLYLLDWILPDVEGDEVLRRLRQERDVTSPVIFVTSRDAEEDVVAALQAGADDYMTKPLRRMELVSRVEAVLRRVLRPLVQPVLELGNYRFDLASRQAQLSGETVVLTDKEFDLALFLFRHQGQLVSRGHLLEAVWGKNANIATRTLDTHVSRLRGKLSLRPENGLRLASVYNFGYRLEAV
ncbi:MAG: response regulator transcription factor [Rhodocyclaceae bacterium]|nr:response regulator transcription factor [Rhodocyclaceae bacterium]